MWEGGGEVTLFEGDLRFIDGTGVRTIAAGERLRFGGSRPQPELPRAGD